MKSPRAKKKKQAARRLRRLGIVGVVVRAIVRRVAATAAPLPVKAAVALGDEVYVLLLPMAAFGAVIGVDDEPDCALLTPFVIESALAVPVAFGVTIQAVGAEAVDHYAFM